MRKMATRTALLLVLLAAGALLLPAAASAQYREFTGRIDRINNKKMIVDNRKGDKVSFHRPEGVEVSGEGKESWDDLKKGDWVSVSWKMMDKPRLAYKVKVLPPKEDD